MQDRGSVRRNDMSSELRLQLDDLALSARILEAEGHGSRTLGHVAMRDPDERGTWIKRSDLGLGEVRRVEDFVLVGWDGRALVGEMLHREWPMHAAVFEARPEIRYTAHTHAFHCRVFSAVKEPLRQVSSVLSYFDEPPPRYDATSELIDTMALGRDMTRCLGRHHVLFLRNHGVLFCGQTVEQMTVYGIAVEEACREALLVSASKFEWSSPPADEQGRKARSMGGPAMMRTYWNFLRRRIDSVE